MGLQTSCVYFPATFVYEVMKYNSQLIQSLFYHNLHFTQNNTGGVKKQQNLTGLLTIVTGFESKL